MSDAGYYATPEFRRARRFALWACGVGLVAAYAMVVPLKWYDLMPEYLGWVGLLTLPVAMFGVLAWGFVAPLLFPRHPDATRTAGVFGWGIILLVVLWIERG